MWTRLIIGMITLLVTPTAMAFESFPVAFNGMHLGDSVGKIKETRRKGQCEGSGGRLTECTIFDNAGIAYEINDGHIIRIEAKHGVTAANARLPFGMKLGSNFSEALMRGFPQDGGQAFVIPGKKETTFIRMIQEPGTEYEFELQLRFSGEGKLLNVIYKDVM